MLVDTPQIIWHGGEAGKNAPVLSLDTHPLALDQTHEGVGVGHTRLRFVLATAGTDAEVRLWIVWQPSEEDEDNWEQPDVSGRLQTFLASLEGHQRGVNVVRFSPDGLSLASASDGGTVVIWSVGEANAWSKLKSDRDTHKEILRGATEDIYDLTWSPDSKFIACGSIDRRSHVWEVATKRSIATLEDHSNYVQVRGFTEARKKPAVPEHDKSHSSIKLTSVSTKYGCEALKNARVYSTGTEELVILVAFVTCTYCWCYYMIVERIRRSSAGGVFLFFQIVTVNANSKGTKGKVGVPRSIQQQGQAKLLAT